MVKIHRAGRLFSISQVIKKMRNNKRLALAGIVALAGGSMLPVQAEENKASLSESEDQMVVTVGHMI